MPSLPTLFLATFLVAVTSPEPTPLDSATVFETPAPIFGPLTFGAWIQPLFEYRDWHDDESSVGFRLRRARLIVDGSGLEGRVRFRLMPDLGSTPQLRDAWVELRRDRLSIRMGQQTVPFHLQRELSMARGHFGDRALASRRFELSGGRDVGVVLGGSNSSRTVRVSAGVFNGRGANRTEPSPSPLLAARGSVGLGGVASNGETDLARSPTPVVTLGAGVMGARDSFLRPRPGFAADQTSDWWAWTADLHARYRGASLVAGWLEHSVTTPPPGSPSPPAEIDGSGWFVGGGWVLPAIDMEISLRHSEARWDRGREDTAERETAIGLTFFHQLHLLQSRVQVTRERGMLTGLSDGSMRITLEHQLFL